jgi:heme/copper-type cytochrome/quinol oxidase subunit 4
MLGDIPAAGIGLSIALMVVPFTIVIASLWGRRGLLIALGCLAVFFTAQMIWYFGFRSRDDWTGLEGITFIVVPIIWLAAAATSFFGYAVTFLLGLLPYQRRLRKK